MPGFLNIAHDQGKLLNITTIEDIHCYDISLIDPTLSKEDGQNLWSLYGQSTMDPLYVPIVQRAYELWRDLEARSEKQLMTLNGGLMIGPPDGMVVGGTLRSATEFDLPHEVLTAAEVNQRQERPLDTALGRSRCRQYAPDRHAPPPPQKRLYWL